LLQLDRMSDSTKQTAETFQRQLQGDT